MLYSVDRISGGITVLIDETGVAREVASKQLPPNLREGDMLRLENSVYSIDTEETRRQREKSGGLLDKLLGR